MRFGTVLLLVGAAVIIGTSPPWSIAGFVLAQGGLSWMAAELFAGKRRDRQNGRIDNPARFRVEQRPWWHHGD